MPKINTILQCFVDLNLELDENTSFTLTELPSISFEQPSYDVVEGQVVEIPFALSAPSVNGLEEVEVSVVVNNTSVSDFNTIGETYPKSFTFSAGQQTKQISILIEDDLFEEDPESFDVIIGSFTNVNPGQYITTTVNIVDSTNLKNVSISEQGGAVIQGNPDTLLFSALEGTSKTVTVSLDSPSTQGVESVDVQFTDVTVGIPDYSIVGNTTLTWNVGEQTKTLSIQANEDEEIEEDEVLQIELVNPVNVNIVDFSEATVQILDASPEARYATANFQGFYVQKGDKSVVNAQARWLRRNPNVGFDAPNNDQMFIKFGEPIVKSYTEYNSPDGSSSGLGYDAGTNTIVGYDPNLFGNLQHNNLIFFGEKPTVSFGPGTNVSVSPTGPKEYGDLRLVIKNVGTHPAKISGSTLSVNDSITVNVDKFDYSIKLPANSVLLSGGTFFNGSPLVEDTLTQCLYEFAFEVDYEELGFQLRNFDNSVSTTKVFNLGVHNLVETYTSANADLPQNHHNLISAINNVWPYWETVFSFPQTGPYCLPAGNFSNTNPPYPLQGSDLQNVLIDGIMFLHQTTQNQNSSNTTKTEYSNFFFLPSGQTAAASGCTGVDIEYDNAFQGELLTSSIPFVVV